jgi:hypothetical protein
MNDARKYHERKKGYGLLSESQREEKVAVYSRLASEMNKMEKHLHFHMKS